MRKISLAASMLAITLTGLCQVKYDTYSEGLKIRTPDNSVEMKWSFRVQSLVSYSNDFTGTSENLSAMIRRSRIKSSGFLFDPRFKYKFELGLSNRDLGNKRDESRVNNAPKLVLDAVLKYGTFKNQELWMGQTKLPGNRERVVSSQSLQFVDRSMVNSNFNIDRDFGLQYHYKPTIKNVAFAFIGAVSTGEGRNITANNQGGLCYTGRFEFLPFGKFADKGDYFLADLSREQKPKLSIGVTYSYNDRTDRSGGQLGNFISDSLGPIENSIKTTFVDAIFKYKGISFLSEYAIKNTSKSIEGFTTGDGFVAQIGYLLKNNIECAGRFTNVNLMLTPNTTSTINEYTLCISKYIVEHKLKWQTDFALFNQAGKDLNYRYRFQLEFGI